MSAVIVGVVECAIARALSPKRDDVFLLDGTPKLAKEAKSGKSRVIHSGLYYMPKSLKANPSSKVSTA